MKTLRVILGLFLIANLFISAKASGDSYKEPQPPDTNKVFDADKENKIKDLSGLNTEDALKKMKGDDFICNADLLYKAIYKTFNSKKGEVLTLVGQTLSLPLTQPVEGDADNTQRDFLVSKRILETFPDDAVDLLLSLYDSGDSTARGNAIRASGKVAGGKAVKNLLIAALDDTDTYEEPNSDDLGDPRRVCDIAYNELVLRYAIKNVHRTIGPALSCEVRDQLISILKTKFK